MISPILSYHAVNFAKVN